MKNFKILGFVVLVLAVGFGVVPLQKSVKKTQTDQQLLVAKKEKKVEEFRKLQLLMTPATQATVAKSPERQIPPTAEQESLIRDLYRIIRGLGFEFDGLNFSKSYNEKVQSPQINASFSIKGTRSQVQNFLRAVEENERFLGLENLGQLKNTEPNSGVIQLSVSLYSFYQQELE
ncbi:hypothetical protein HN954_05090 [bacterium]|jgi:Tfp pilus assembly protein PilO|nr:hypothetical protein [bacterium]MBT6832324.1 hypothetical protein [bacterium]MBT6996769.1 hypothetical protein [bacterium]MBT7772818.1 hypothetical protein [bacterium]